MPETPSTETSPETADTDAATSIVDTVLDLDEFFSGDVRRARKSVRISTTPHLEADLDRLDDELDSLTDGNGNPLDNPDEEAMGSTGRTALVVAQEYRETQRRYAAGMRRVEVEQMPEDEWSAWFRVNEKKLEASDTAAFNDLIVKCAVAPTFSLEQVNKLRKTLGHPQVDEIANAAWRVNTKSGVDVPKSALSSHVLKQRARGRS